MDPSIDLINCVPWFVKYYLYRNYNAFIMLSDD